MTAVKAKRLDAQVAERLNELRMPSLEERTDHKYASHIANFICGREILFVKDEGSDNLHATFIRKP